MPALGAPELIIILVLVVIIFGAGKLPEMGSALGKGIKEFRNANESETKTASKETPENTNSPAA